MINLRSIDLNLLTVFHALMENRSISKAALQLNVSQPAVSQALSRLRLTFKDELFLRSHKGMIPTEKALVLELPISEALSIIKNTLDIEQAFNPDIEEKCFRISFGPLGEMFYFSTILQHLLKFEGNLTIQSTSEANQNGLEHLIRGETDFSLDYEKPNDKRLRYIQLNTQPYVVIARKNHPRCDQKLTKKMYFKEKHAILKLDEQQRRNKINSAIKKMGAERSIAAEARSYSSIPDLVRKTDLIATVPLQLATLTQYKSQLNIFPFPEVKPEVKHFLIWNAAREKETALLWLKDQLVAILNEKTLVRQ